MATPSTYAHYKCNDDAANTVVTDDGSGANNGVANVNTSNYSVVGKINDAFEFNGSSEYINIDALLADIKTDTTGSFAFWLYPGSGGTGINTIFSWGEDGGLDQFRIYHANDILTVAIRDSDPDNLIYSTPVSDDTWTHVVVTQDSSQLRIYINSSVVSPTKSIDTTPGAWLAFATNADSGRIGSSRDNSGTDRYWFVGKTDDFRYYQSTVLTEQDVLNIYRGGTGTEDDPPDYFSPGFPHSQVYIIS